MKTQPSPSTGLKSLLFGTLFLLPPFAMAKEPSVESVHKLFEVSAIQQTTLDQMIKFRAMVDAMVNDTVVEQKLTPPQMEELKKKLPAFSATLQKIVEEEMSWSKIKPSYTKIFTKKFSQEEVNGLITFYKSPTGKAFLEKMPQINEEITKASIDRLPLITARVKKASDQFLEKLQPPAAKK